MSLARSRRKTPARSPARSTKCAVGFQEISGALAENLRLRVGGGVVEDGLGRLRIEAEMSEPIAVVVIEVPMPQPRRVVLAQIRNGVAVAFEHHRQGIAPRICRERAAAVPADRVPPLPLPGEQAGAVREARGRGSERVFKHRTLTREPIDVRRFDQRMTRATEFIEPLIIGEDENDIGLLPWTVASVQRGQRREQQGGEECEGVVHGLSFGSAFQFHCNANKSAWSSLICRRTGWRGSVAWAMFHGVISG